jgi:HTH-type transcriptional regulator/antitoxin HigA
MSSRAISSLDAASAEKMVTTFKNAVRSIPLLGSQPDENEYRNALALIEFLIDSDDTGNPLFELLSLRIAEYEKSAPEFSALNDRLKKTPQGVALLRTLMDQHGLKAADLANELGSKSNVSNILNGRRALTVRHIAALAERFKLPAQAFIS